MTPDTPCPNYLATGFRDVDGSGDADAFSGCLDLISRTPVFQEIKEESYRIIATANPAWVLDAGCGAGMDLAALASRLPDSCRLAGLDASASLLTLAAERTEPFREKCSMIRGDLLSIPFRDNMFDATRIDRVLQHLHEPEAAVRELFRVTAPGGACIAFDNDWDTFSLALDDENLARRISIFWRDSFASGRIGRCLSQLFGKNGFEEIHVKTKELHMKNLTAARKIFDLDNLLGRMVHAHQIREEERDSVMQELESRFSDQSFSVGYTGYLLQGKKPLP